MKDGKNAKTNAKDKGRNDLAKKLPKNKKAFEKEVTLLPDTTLLVKHGKNSKRLIISAKTADGKMRFFGDAIKRANFSNEKYERSKSRSELARMKKEKEDRKKAKAKRWDCSRWLPQK